jgi:hypothetical protein
MAERVKVPRYRRVGWQPDTAEPLLAAPKTTRSLVLSANACHTCVNHAAAGGSKL